MSWQRTSMSFIDSKLVSFICFPVHQTSDLPLSSAFKVALAPRTLFSSDEMGGRPLEGDFMNMDVGRAFFLKGEANKENISENKGCFTVTHIEHHSQA